MVRVFFAAAAGDMVHLVIFKVAKIPKGTLMASA